MKMKKLQNALLVGLVIITTITACTKGDGPIQGSTSTTGPAGPQGPTGTSNVKVYHWGLRNTSVSTEQTIDYKIPTRDSAEIDSLEFHFYVMNTDPTWYSLPGTFTFGDDYFRVLTFLSDQNDSITFSVRRVARLSLDSNKNSAVTFNAAKAVIVPAGTFTNLRTNINWNDYNDVKQKLHLKDEDEIEVK